MPSLNSHSASIIFTDNELSFPAIIKSVYDCMKPKSELNELLDVSFLNKTLFVDVFIYVRALILRVRNEVIWFAL